MGLRGVDPQTLRPPRGTDILHGEGPVPYASVQVTVTRDPSVFSVECGKEIPPVNNTFTHGPRNLLEKGVNKQNEGVPSSVLSEPVRRDPRPCARNCFRGCFFTRICLVTLLPGVVEGLR